MPDIKRILILYADAGFGHRSAANALAAAFQEKYGEHCQVMLVNPLEDRRILPILRDSQADYDKMVRNSPELYRLGFKASDSAVPVTIFESALIIMLYEVMRDLVERYQPDAVITTYPLYQAPLDAVFTLGRQRVPVFTVVTDLAIVHQIWFNRSVEYCMVATEQLRDLAIQAGLKPEQVLITGIPVHPDLIGENCHPETLREELGWRKELTTILAVGSRRVEGLEEILHILNHSALPVQLAVVTGGDDDLYSRLITKEWHLPAYVHNYVENMPTFMQAADLILCKAGGLIVTESLACCLPLLLIEVIPGQETGNAEYVIAEGAGELAETPVQVLETLYHWLANGGELLAERARNACRVGKPRAAYTICEHVWEVMERGLPPKKRANLFSREKLKEMLKGNRAERVE